MNAGRDNFELVFVGGFQVLFEDFGSDADDVLPLPIFDQIQRLQGGDDVFGLD